MTADSAAAADRTDPTLDRSPQAQPTSATAHDAAVAANAGAVNAGTGASLENVVVPASDRATTTHRVQGTGPAATSDEASSARTAPRDRRAPTAPELSPVPLGRRVVAELCGAAFLVAGVVGSGIMAERLTDDPGLQLLQNAVATAGVLGALILALAPASGAHFNPAVTLAAWLLDGIDRRSAAAYVVAQLTGGILGAVVANVMFDLPAVAWSSTERSAGHLWFAEAVATLGLVLVIFGVVRSGRGGTAAFAVAGYIAGAYYFTSSTSFANPAVTLARAFSDTFTGIAPGSVPPFVAAELVGALVAAGLVLAIYPSHVAGARRGAQS